MDRRTETIDPCQPGSAGQGTLSCLANLESKPLLLLNGLNLDKEVISTVCKLGAL